MSRARSAAVAVALAGLLIGCSSGGPTAAPELPERICWGGAFAGGDVSPFLPPGTRAEFSPQADRAFALDKELDSAICTLYIDGKMDFQASATRWNFAESIDWTSRASDFPERIDVGDKGIMWRGGASSFFACESAKNQKSPGKYIELRISADYAPGKYRLRAALPELMEKLMAFARSELRCPGK
ncbi:hypothetical protein [Streptomyces sp. cmx-10-25]|uniref:hypothetical protein n=1 Tax=Streptomyces sp. cmx-10-25 TaxID=2790919 RepID=UPI003981086C